MLASQGVKYKSLCVSRMTTMYLMTANEHTLDTNNQMTPSIELRGSSKFVWCLNHINHLSFSRPTEFHLTHAYEWADECNVQHQINYIEYWRMYLINECKIDKPNNRTHSNSWWLEGIPWILGMPNAHLSSLENRNEI